MAVQDLRETRQVGRREDLGLPCKALQSGTHTDDIPAGLTTALTGASIFFINTSLFSPCVLVSFGPCDTTRVI